MRRYRLQDLPPSGTHIFSGLVPDEFICEGALRFRPPGYIAHPEEPIHAHDLHEVFVIWQGKARMRLADRVEELGPGDVAVAEPNEDHHLEIDETDPALYVYFQFGPERHPEQRGR